MIWFTGVIFVLSGSLLMTTVTSEYVFMIYIGILLIVWGVLALESFIMRSSKNKKNYSESNQVSVTDKDEDILEGYELDCST